MAEVRVIARAVAREGKANELKELLRGLVKPTRTENGCKFYELYESSLPGLFYFNELWQSQAHLDAHLASSHFTTITGKAKELVQGPLEVNFLQGIE
jgi:quinol monooxygenase YgiN